MKYEGGHFFMKGTLPHQEFGFVFFMKHLVWESFLRFQANHHFTNFTYPSRPEAH